MSGGEGVNFDYLSNETAGKPPILLFFFLSFGAGTQIQHIFPGAAVLFLSLCVHSCLALPEAYL